MRAEGGVLFTLHPTPHRALEDDDGDRHPRVYALVASTSCNQDGASSGLTAPNGLAQESLLRAAYALVGASPSECGAMEVHGTGTKLGDPIEVAAVGCVMAPAAGSHESACLHMGSVKTNVGHMEPSAGAIGLLKVVLSLKHNMLPPQIHLTKLNPHLDLLQGKLCVLVAPLPLQLLGTSKPAVVAVSSFGFSGTNAHAVLRATAPPAARVERLSAASQEALLARLEDARQQMPNSPLPSGAQADPSDNAWRACVSLDSIPDDKALRALHAPKLAAAVTVVYVCSGHGSQYPGCGQDMYATDAHFAQSFRRIDQLFQALAGWSLLDAMAGSGRSIDEAAVVPPLVFAIEVSVAAAWRARGVQAAAVLGHSFGEVTAAHLCGALSLESAVQLVWQWGVLTEKLDGTGTLLVVGAPSTRAAQLAASAGCADMEVAGMNTPASTTLAGTSEQISRVTVAMSAAQVFSAQVRIGYPAHSSACDGAAIQLEESTLPSSGATRIPMVSSCVGGVQTRFDAPFWRRVMREPCNLMDAVQAVPQLLAPVPVGSIGFVELSPHPLLCWPISQLLPEAQTIASLRRDAPGSATLQVAEAQLWRCGFASSTTALTTTPQQPLLWLVSGVDSASCAANAAATAEHLNGSNVRPMDVAFSLAVTRHHFDNRAYAVSTADRIDATRVLSHLAVSHEEALLVGRRSGKVAFAFTGQTGLWKELPMLFAEGSHPVLRNAWKEVWQRTADRPYR